MTLAVSVVTPTKDRPEGLAALVRALEAQTLPPDRFELIVVDDGSERPQEVASERLAVRVLRHDTPHGPAAARNRGWRAARAALVAFVDDDCAPSPRWLEAMLSAASPHPGDVVVQGRVEPPAEQRGEIGPLSHVIEAGELNRLFVTCNIAYARDLLERLEGFDETFTRACGEDVDLGARASKAGAAIVFAHDALVLHEVRQRSLLQVLRHTTIWTDGVRALARHPELRDLLVARVFWKPAHPWLLLALAGALSRRPLVALAAAAPYLVHRRSAGRDLPVLLAIDLTEVATAVAGSVRHRTLML